jgi:hypothetical protein
MSAADSPCSRPRSAGSRQYIAGMGLLLLATLFIP